MREQKLLFTLLCFSKASTPTNNWVTTPARVFFKSAGINLSIKDQDAMIFQLKNKGFLINSRFIDVSKISDFMDKINNI